MDVISTITFSIKTIYTADCTLPFRASNVFLRQKKSSCRPSHIVSHWRYWR